MAALTKNVVYNVLLSLSQLLFPLLTFPYAARVLGAAHMGAVNFADSVVTYFLILAALGIPLYGVREIARAKQNPALLGKVCSELIVIHFLTSIACGLLLFLTSTSIPQLQGNLALYQLGILILIGNVAVLEWLFQGLEAFRYLAIRTMLIRLSTIPLLYFFVKGPQDQVLYYALNLWVILATSLSNFFVIRKTLKLSFTGLSIKKHIQPLLWLFGGILASTIYLVFDTIILGFLTNDATVAYYSAAMRVTKVSLTVLSAVALALLPRFSQVFLQNDLIKAKALLHKSIGFVIWFGLPLAIGICCLSNEIIFLFAGAGFLPAGHALKILSGLVLVLGFAQVFAYQILLPKQQEKQLLWAGLAGAIISLLLNFSLIPLWAHLGAAFSALLTELVVTLLLYHFASKQIQISVPWTMALQSSLSCCSFFAFRYLLQQITHNAFFILIFTALLSAICYVAMQLWVWKNKAIIELWQQYRPWIKLNGD